MRVLITGVGDAFTSRHFGSSALVDGPGGLVLLDCPDLIHRALREATAAAGWTADATAIDDVILTHLHGDHCNGLESLGFMRRALSIQDPDRPRPRLHTSEAAAARLWERLGPAMDAPFGDDKPSRLDDFFDVAVLPDDDTAQVAGLTVRTRFTKHPIPTLGLMISDGERTLGWSGDTAFDPDHIEWLREADLIVHESNRGPAHTAIESLNGLPDELRTKMRLIHLPDDFDAGCTDIRSLRQGDVLEV